MVDFPDKSKPAPEEPPKKVLPKGVPAVAVKRPATRRFLDYVMAESPKALAKKIGRDQIVPRLKQGLQEAVSSFIDGMLWGDGANRPSGLISQQMMRGGGMNYSQISTSAQPLAIQQARQATVQSATSPHHHDVAFTTQAGAEQILANMYDVLNMYRVVAVADLKEMCEIPTETQDNAYGWVSLDGARITQQRAGFVLSLPKATLI